MTGNHRRENISSSDCGGRREERRARFGDRQVGQGEDGNSRPELGRVEDGQSVLLRIRYQGVPRMGKMSARLEIRPLLPEQYYG